MSTLPSLEERLREYATAQLMTLEATREIIELVKGRPDIDAAALRDLGVTVTLLEAIVGDLEKILSGEELEIVITEFEL